MRDIANGAIDSRSMMDDVEGGFMAEERRPTLDGTKVQKGVSGDRGNYKPSVPPNYNPPPPARVPPPPAK